MVGLYPMAAIRQRNDPVRLFGRRLMLLALLILVFAIAWGVWNARQKEQESGSLRAQAQRQLNDLTERQVQLNADIANLQTERGKEEVLREQYALAAEGEGLIVIVDQPASKQTQASSTMLDKIKHAFSWW